MKHFLAVILLTLIAISKTNADIVKNFTVNGNKRISEETIKIYGKIELNKDYTEKDLNEVLQNLYSTKFFEDIDLKISNNNLVINVKEFPIVNQLIVLGEKSNKYVEQVKKVISTKAKRSFIKSDFIKDIELIKTLYSTAGYNFAEVNTKIKEIDSENLDIVIEIKRNDVTVISTINFVGDKKVKDSRLRAIIASEEHKFWKIISKNSKFNENLIQLDTRLLKTYYQSIGYKDVEVTSSFVNLNQSGNIDLTYSIEAGKRYRIGKLSTNLDNVFDKKIFFPINKFYKKVSGEYYSPFKITNLLEEIDAIIEKNNLQFVEHNVEEEKRGDYIDLKFNIYEGEKFSVDRINILGNNITDEAVIRGEMKLDEGDPFTDLALQKSIAEIKQRNIFKTVQYNVKEGSEINTKIIDIIVEEKPTGEISAGAGVGTSGGTIAFNIKENNWLGEGKNVGLNFEITSESILGNLNYSDPNYNFLGNSISYGISSERNDKASLGYENSIQSIYANTSFEQYKNVFADLGLSASYDDLQTDNTASANLKKQAGTFTEIAGQYGFSFDSRDRVFNPTKGSIIKLNQSLPLIADKPYIQNTFSGSFYKLMSEDFVWATKFYLNTIDGLDNEDVRLSKRVSLSSKRLRGFERNKIGPKDGDDYIGGNYAAAVNFETNLPNLLPEKTNVDVSFFLDFGNVWGVDFDSSLDDSNKIRSSTGLAANWLSPIGPLSFTLSQNLSKANTDETESFNFNLGTTF